MSYVVIPNDTKPILVQIAPGSPREPAGEWEIILKVHHGYGKIPDGQVFLAYSVLTDTVASVWQSKRLSFLHRDDLRTVQGVVPSAARIRQGVRRGGAVGPGGSFIRIAETDVLMLHMMPRP